MFAEVIRTEFMKLHRCRVTWFTLAGLSMGPLGIALFMWIVREPRRASELGLLGTKANLAGLEATWSAYVEMLTLIVGVGGMLLLPFIVAYVFGREYVDGTMKNVLALPVDRSAFVLAKLLVAFAWWVVLVLAVVAEALVVGAVLHLPGFSARVATSGIRGVLLALAISYLIVPVTAWVTVASRSYIAPLGFAIAMMALGNVFGKTGWSNWFPWSLVPSLVGMIGTPSAALPAGSYVVLAVTFIGGIVATVAQLRYADCSQ
jgi:ABC-2 type transport system permease protein